jgi:hypothetical protein
MNKYEVKIVSNIEGSQVILLQAFLYANNEDTANVMANNVFENYQNNSNYTVYHEGIVVQRQLNLVE